jgi:hypothetical protein
MTRIASTRHLNCISYLSTRANKLFVSKSYRAQVAKILRVESEKKKEWFLPRRGYAVKLVNVNGLIRSNLMDDREGDERIRKGFKCGQNHPPAHKACIPIDSTSSYDLLGYSECVKGASEDTCDEIYVKIGETHEWNATCEKTWGDFPVYRWVCLP